MSSNLSNQELKAKKMNKREDILAEINILKVFVWKLWEEAHGSISNEDWNDMKKEVINTMRRDK